MLRSGAALLRTLRQGAVAGSAGIEQSGSRLPQVKTVGPYCVIFSNPFNSTRLHCIIDCIGTQRVRSLPDKERFLMPYSILSR